MDNSSRGSTRDFQYLSGDRPVIRAPLLMHDYLQQLLDIFRSMYEARKRDASDDFCERAEERVYADIQHIVERTGFRLPPR